MDDGYVPRLVDAELSALMEQFPAVLLAGPRAAGKTTTARRHASAVARLDREREAAAFVADPDAALRATEEPVLLDEWQVVPQVLGAVKRAVDDDPRPGRFVLTGSVTAEHDPATWPGVGRIIRLSMFGLTQRELAGRATDVPLLQRLLEGNVPATASLGGTPDLVDYVELALQGTFPEPVLRIGSDQRQRWYRTYADQLVGRDARTLGAPDTARLDRYVQALAACTAGVVSETTLLDLASIDRKTAAGYDRLLGGLYALDIVPAWSSRRLTRLVKTPKRYIIDPALAAAILRSDRQTILGDGDLLGRVLDTFVAAQIRPELDLMDPPGRHYHLRDAQGRHEVDMVIDFGSTGIVGIEVKADAAPTPSAARHLMWLRDQLNDRFIAGLVMHTGSAIYELSERITAIPICALWTSP